MGSLASGSSDSMIAVRVGLRMGTNASTNVAHVSRNRGRSREVLGVGSRGGSLGEVFRGRGVGTRVSGRGVLGSPHKLTSPLKGG